MADDLQRAYRQRFADRNAYREAVWQFLVRDVLQRWMPHDSRVRDLGCGWDAFIHHVVAAERFGMDLNPDSAAQLDQSVNLFAHDCAQRWPLKDDPLDVVFSSNLFEHLPGKQALHATLMEAARCLWADGSSAWAPIFATSPASTGISGITTPTVSFGL